MSIIELVIVSVLLIAAGAVVNSIASIPPPTKKIVNIVIGALAGNLILVFVLSLLGIGLHRRI